MSSNEDFVRGESSGGAERPVPEADETLAEGTVLSAGRTVPESQPEEETAGEATPDQEATGATG